MLKILQNKFKKKGETWEKNENLSDVLDQPKLSPWKP